MSQPWTRKHRPVGANQGNRETGGHDDPTHDSQWLRGAATSRRRRKPGRSPRAAQLHAHVEGDEGRHEPPAEGPAREGHRRTPARAAAQRGTRRPAATGSAWSEEVLDSHDTIESAIKGSTTSGESETTPNIDSARLIECATVKAVTCFRSGPIRAEQEEPQHEQDMVQALREDVLEPEDEILPRGLDHRRLDEPGAQVESPAVLTPRQPDGRDRLSRRRDERQRVRTKHEAVIDLEAAGAARHVGR